MVHSARASSSSSNAGAWSRRGVGEDLDLVELVGAQHARACPDRPSPASRRKHGVEAIIRIGSWALVQHLVAGERRERHLGGRDAPQVVALDGVGVVGELRQLPGGRERGGQHERGGPDLLEHVGVAVEGELAERPGQRGAQPPLHREHGAADLHGPLDVEDAEGRSRPPSGGRAGGRRSHRDRSRPPARPGCRRRWLHRAPPRPGGWG